MDTSGRITGTTGGEEGGTLNFSLCPFCIFYISYHEHVLPIQKVAIVNFFKKRDAKDISFLSILAGAEV